MQFPVTRHQLIAGVESFGFKLTDAEKIVKSLETEGRIELSGSMVSINNPTDQDAQVLAGLCRESHGATAGSVGANKITEYLTHTLENARKHGSSARV